MSSRIRVRGQRSILSTFAHLPSANNNDDEHDCRENLQKKKRQKISLSDFLDRKLQKTSDPSKLLQGKERPFLSPGTSVGANRLYNGANAEQKAKGPDSDGTLDIVLEQFKHNKENEDNVCCSVQSSTGTYVTKESQSEGLRKQTNQFEGLSSASCLLFSLIPLLEFHYFLRYVFISVHNTLLLESKGMFG
ncbi:hypothetical protein Hanom_Chr13g01243171 [Helianthus anomalus]